MAEITLTDATFEQEVIKSDIPVLVDFWAEWCQPCKIIGPLIEELAIEYEGRIKVGKINVDENPDAPSNYGIMSIPTIIIFKGGKPVETMIGVQPRENLKRSIEQALASS
jgi:thioredoxin 1